MRNWMDFHMELAKTYSEMSTCVSGRKVGAVAIRDNRLLSAGFNGVPSGYPHPEVCARREAGQASGSPMGSCVCIHAEANMVANAARHGVALLGSVVYSSTQPCNACMGLLVNVGVTSVFYNTPYPNQQSDDIAFHGGVRLFQYAPGDANGKEQV